MKKVLDASILVLLFACAGYAAPASVVTGTIKGPDGAPFRAAFIRAENTKTHITMMVLSNNQGRYVTDSLAPGTYDVWATSIGYKGDPARRSSVTLEDKIKLTIDFTIQKSPV